MSRRKQKYNICALPYLRSYANNNKAADTLPNKKIPLFPLKYTSFIASHNLRNSDRKKSKTGQSGEICTYNYISFDLYTVKD